MRCTKVFHHFFPQVNWVSIDIFNVELFACFDKYTLNILMSLKDCWIGGREWSNNVMVKYFVKNGTVQFGNSPLIDWSQIDRRGTREKDAASTTLPYTLYTSIFQAINISVLTLVS